MSVSILALDVGGANLKAAHSRGGVRFQPFELWRNPAGLADALRDLIAPLPPFDLLAVTMTGELCDCFETKRQGVNAILDAVAAAAGSVPVRVWQTDGTLVASAAARAEPLRTAAANWLALASYAGRFAPTGPGLVLDIGSTTTDIIPLLDGRPVPQGRTDFARLEARELVYTGARRTPLCALLGSRGAAEFFATTLDVYLVLGLVAEDSADRNSADGRPATLPNAHARLARMLCADAEGFTAAQARQLASELADLQTALICEALAAVALRLPGPPGTVMLAGSGEFLARRVIAACPLLRPARVVSLTEALGPDVSRAACAYALAVLVAEQGRSR
jgi:probable H4MPT-linked C1 transfer pathway protein